MAQDVKTSKNPVLHVVVIGFHHKKGCQVDYSYPPLLPGGEVNSNETPVEWKHLPSLAVPDGAHNYVKDTIYFHLPALEGTHRTVYGVACYRQIDSRDLKKKSTDVTRSTVQKSVCVLSYLPLYGLIQAKLELITHAYFQELDFSQVSLLEETYKNLNLSLTTSLLDGGSQVYLGMEIKDVVQQFKHKIMVLFKLILLERRVLFTGSPVENLGNTLLAVLSLFPGMIEHGLVECTAYGIHHPISPTMKSKTVGDEGEEYLEIRYSDQVSPEPDNHSPLVRCNSQEPESPTIERGDHSLNLHKGDNSLNSLNKGDNYVQSTGISDAQSDRNQNDIVKSCVTKLDYVEDHYSNNSSQSGETRVQNLDSQQGTSGGSHDQSHDKSHERKHDRQQVLLADNSMMMMGVTQYEAVQAGKCIPKKGSVINIEDVSQTMDIDDEYFGSISERATIGSAPGDLSLSLEDDHEGHEGSEVNNENSVEDLDSPESISQIDQEDCFSWEDDRVSLTIDIEKNSNSLDENAGLASSFKEVSLLEKHCDKVRNSAKLGRSNSLDNRVTNTSNVTKVKPDSGGSSKENSRESSPGMKASAIKSRLSNAFSGINLKQKLRNKSSSSREGSDASEPTSPSVENKSVPELPVLHQDDFGFPLAVFTKGSVCFPYLSLQYFDLLNDVNIRSFVIGATNILFKQKRHLTDVVIDINDFKIEIHDRELQRQLTLTTADLRFADILVKAVTGSGDDVYLDGTVPKRPNIQRQLTLTTADLRFADILVKAMTGSGDDVFLDGTEWEGNDEWLRVQFRLYLESLLASSLAEDPKLQEDFGSGFMQAWKTTHNYRVWSSKTHSGFESVQAGHPCQGNLGVSDIKMRLSHTMQNTEGGKKINAAVTQTGKYVMQTGKAVGGALTSAKSSLSSWLSSWKTSEKTTSSQTTEMAKSQTTETAQPQTTEDTPK